MDGDRGNGGCWTYGLLVAALIEACAILTVVLCVVGARLLTVIL